MITFKMQTKSPRNTACSNFAGDFFCKKITFRVKIKHIKYRKEKEAKKMPEKILVVDNSTFFVTCRISGEELQDVQDIQWFLAGDNQSLLADQTCQSVILDAAWIAKQAEGKWLGYRYTLDGIQYEKMLCFLSVDLMTLLKWNSFDRLDVCDIYGNAKDVYTKRSKNNAKK